MKMLDKYAHAGFIYAARATLENDAENARHYRVIARFRKSASGTFIREFCVWCLWGGVAFRELASRARSVILTSGTLSPMDSFECELGIKFKHRLEAAHVIDPRRVWAGSLGKGPRGKTLLCTKRGGRHGWDFLEEIGGVVLESCRVIPAGVLVFFTSYPYMKSVIDRWRCVFLHQNHETHRLQACYRAARCARCLTRVFCRAFDYNLIYCTFCRRAHACDIRILIFWLVAPLTTRKHS